MSQELISSLILTATGVGAVFLFLFITVIVIDVVSTFLSRYTHLLEAPAAKKPASAPKADNNAVIAAIAVAMQNR